MDSNSYFYSTTLSLRFLFSGGSTVYCSSPGSCADGGSAAYFLLGNNRANNYQKWTKNFDDISKYTLFYRSNILKVILKWSQVSYLSFELSTEDTYVVITFTHDEHIHLMFQTIDVGGANIEMIRRLSTSSLDDETTSLRGRTIGKVFRTCSIVLFYYPQYNFQIWLALNTFMVKNSLNHKYPLGLQNKAETCM